MAVNYAKQIGKLLKSAELPALSELDIRAICLPQDLLILATITFPHWIFSRYPDAKITPVDYTPALGVVSDLPKIVVQLKQELLTLEKMK